MQTITNPDRTYPAPFFPQPATLDDHARQLLSGNVTPVLDELFDRLLRSREEERNWSAFASSCLQHPLRHLLHSDPLTYRAFTKPRGYAGDAVMMDYVYGLGEAANATESATPLGRAIFEYIDARPSARAVRFRRQLLASLIDQTAARRKGASVLAVAAGHLREVELSNAVREGELASFVAFDQDKDSLALIARNYAAMGVTTKHGSVRHILARKAELGQHDLVYAAGLYDYLPENVAIALTRRLFEMTRPGGTLLIPNFVTGALDAGYLESFMDWRLIYRDEREMRELAAALPFEQVANVEVFNDPGDTIVFLQVTKRAAEVLQ